MFNGVGTGVLSPKALGWSDREARTRRMKADVVELELDEEVNEKLIKAWQRECP